MTEEKKYENPQDNLKRLREITKKLDKKMVELQISEEKRIESEDIRIIAEEARVAAEEARIIAENTRVASNDIKQLLIKLTEYLMKEESDAK